MADYVSINTSIPQIVLAANDLTFLSGDIQAAMVPLVAGITEHEGASSWGDDEFAARFLSNYHGDYAASESVKSLACGPDSVGAAGQAIGDSVVDAMLSYADTDAVNGSDMSGIGA